MRHAFFGALLILVAACAGGDDAPLRTQGSGPPEIRADVVERHEAQLDEELGDRPAGSQQEQIASQYVLGHLQRAGYLVRLDAVPVGNLVESSNLLALPASEDDPRVVVVAPYDSPEGDASGGERIGFLLELARAFNVASPDHDVQFVALGAEVSPPERLGSRRLVRLLLDEGGDPAVIEIGTIRAGAPVHAFGPLADAVGPEAVPEILEEESLYGRAGLDWAVVSGDPEELGTVLIDYLEQAGG